MPSPLAPPTQKPDRFNKDTVPTLLQSVLKQTRSVLDQEAGLVVEDVTSVSCAVDRLYLHDLTVLAGLGCPVNVLVAFSFVTPLVEALFDGMKDGLGLTEEEVADGLFRTECAAEAINIILGLSTADLREKDVIITLSPPVVMENTRWIHRQKNAYFATMRLQTNHGVLDVSVVGPRELFDEQLNYTP